ncbi:hypothetical protein RJT34_16402 [Clitoria ternatea]|uniref:Uncharacterized protein n=1 Tax=Clitoria ternatea TaxID=43366 RepID=A0AAN9J8A2_CLITE
MSLFIFISQIIENCAERFPDETEEVTEIVELVKNALPQLDPKEITKDAEETATLKDEKVVLLGVVLGFPFVISVCSVCLFLVACVLVVVFPFSVETSWKGL